VQRELRATRLTSQTWTEQLLLGAAA